MWEEVFSIDVKDFRNLIIIIDLSLDEVYFGINFI